jgi:hypothetical protein
VSIGTHRSYPWPTAGKIAKAEGEALAKLGESAVASAYKRAGVNQKKPFDCKTLRAKAEALHSLGFYGNAAASVSKPSPSPAPSPATPAAMPTPTPPAPSPKPAAPSKPVKPDSIQLYGLCCRLFGGEAGVQIMLENEPSNPEARYRRMEKRILQENLTLPYSTEAIPENIRLPRAYGRMASVSHAERQETINYFFTHNNELP